MFSFVPIKLWKPPSLDSVNHMTLGALSFTHKAMAEGRVLTNLLELLFLSVLAFPKASRRGLDCRMMSLTCCGERESSNDDDDDDDVC